MTPRTWPSLYLAIAISFAVAGLGGSMTDLGPWYEQLKKPDWKPPDAAFGVIWSTIFTLCAFSAWWAWHASNGPRQRGTLLALFAANAALNVFWSLIYFQWHQLGWALVELVFLWVVDLVEALVEEEAEEDSEVLVAEALVVAVPVEAGSLIKKIIGFVMNNSQLQSNFLIDCIVHVLLTKNTAIIPF